MEGNENSESTEGSSSLSFLLAGSLALETLADAISFEKFLKRNSIRKKPLLPGMKLIFDNLIKNIDLQIQFNLAFSLDTDRITERALFKGIPVEGVSSNSSMARVLRGLNRVKEQVCKEKSVPDFHITLSEEFSPLFRATRELFDNHTTIATKQCQGKDKESVLNLFAFSWYLRFLNIRQQVRVPLMESIIADLHEMMSGFEESEIDTEYRERLEEQERKNRERREQARKKFEKYFLGWKTCTAYLWSKLEGILLPPPPITNILGCSSWEELDDLFRPTADSVIAEADKRLGTSTGRVFSRTSECKPTSLGSLMIDYVMKEPVDPFQGLNQAFLWYDFEIMDGAQPKIFPGVSTFTNLLVGTVFMKKSYNWTNPIEIKRILHPAGYHFFNEGENTKKREKHDISYAILVPAFSSVADYSGWLVSLDCCNDYSGFASQMRAFAEAYIEANKAHLSIEDLIISKEEFRDYLKSNIRERHEEPYARLSESEWESIRLEEIGAEMSAVVEIGTEMSAVVIELLMAVLMAELGYEVHWQYRDEEVVGKKEIDVLAVSEKEVQIIECSKHVPINAEGISGLIQEFRRKRKYIENSRFRRKGLTLRYITSKDLDNEPFKQSAEVLRKEGISAENIYQILGKSKHRTKPLLNLLSEIDSMRLGSSGNRQFNNLNS